MKKGAVVQEEQVARDALSIILIAFFKYLYY